MTTMKEFVDKLLRKREKLSAEEAHAILSKYRRSYAATLRGAETGRTRSMGTNGNECARIFKADNGYYAETTAGSVVIGVSLSELFRALQGKLAEEAVRERNEGAGEAVAKQNVTVGGWSPRG